MEINVKLKQLEKEFFLHQLSSSKTLTSPLAPSDKQRALLRSQLNFFYADMSERDALQMLLKMTRRNRGRPARSPSDMEDHLGLMESEKVNDDNTNMNETMAARQFWGFCRRLNFIGFSFPEISVGVGVMGDVKKVPIKFPQWQNINRDNFLAYIDKSHRGFAFCTGKISNITVIDCDTVEVYNELCKEFPSLAKSLSVRTRKGFHIYCSYTSAVPTSSRTFGSIFPNVDVRNDDGIVFSPPTSYHWPGVGDVSYEFVDITAPILPFPEKLAGMMMSTNKAITPTATWRNEMICGIPRDISSVNAIEDLTRKEVQSILKLFRIQPWMVTRTPVISNAIFEIGFHPPIDKSIEYSLKTAGRGSAEMGNCYYMKMFELMVIVITHGDWQKIENTMERFSNDITFDVYKTSGGNYRLYCVSMPIFSRDRLALKLQTTFQCNPEAAQFSALNSWVTPLTNTADAEQDVEISKIGRFGRAPVIHDFTVLINLKDHLISLFNRRELRTGDQPKVLSAEHLKMVLSTLEFPKFQEFLPFISFSSFSSASLASVGAE